MKNKKLLITTVILAIIATLSVSLNVYFIASNPSKGNTDTTNNANTEISGAPMTMFTSIESADLTDYEKKSFEKTETQDAYDMYIKSVDFFDLGNEMLTIKKSGNKTSLARLVIKPDEGKVNSLEELGKIITDKLIAEGHVAKVMQYTKISDNKSEKIENLSSENIKGADRISITLKLNDDVKDKIISISLLIKDIQSDNGHSYEATINYIYERPASSSTQQNTNTNNSNDTNNSNNPTEETHSHNH